MSDVPRRDRDESSRASRVSSALEVGNVLEHSAEPAQRDESVRGRRFVPEQCADRVELDGLALQHGSASTRRRMNPLIEDTTRRPTCEGDDRSDRRAKRAVAKDCRDVALEL
jgi:hypothetical protein